MSLGIAIIICIVLVMYIKSEGSFKMNRQQRKIILVASWIACPFLVLLGLDGNLGVGLAGVAAPVIGHLLWAGK